MTTEILADRHNFQKRFFSNLVVDFDDGENVYQEGDVHSPITALPLLPGKGHQGGLQAGGAGSAGAGGAGVAGAAGAAGAGAGATLLVIAPVFVPFLFSMSWHIQKVNLLVLSSFELILLLLAACLGRCSEIVM